MNGINRVYILGHVGGEPRVRYSKAGKAVTSFSIATNHTIKMSDGEKRTEVEWHRVVTFGRLGEIAGQLINKGSPVCVEGRLHTSEWVDAEGHKNRRTEIIGSSLQVIGRRTSGDSAYVPGNDSPGDKVEAEIPF